MRRRLFSLLLCLMLVFPAFSRETFALVLSGGGERALAEIPVLEELDRRGIVPDMVVGSGMGAFVGGLYAAGYTGREIEELVRAEEPWDLLYHFNSEGAAEELGLPFLEYDTNLTTFYLGDNPYWQEPGLIDDHYLRAFLERQLAKVSDVKDFDELSIPFRAAGADINEGGLTVLSSGSLVTAMRASMAVPVLLEPVELENGHISMYGGMEYTLPVDLAISEGAQVVLLVDVNDVLGYLSAKKTDVSTLGGSVQAFADYLMLKGAEEAYNNSDWVLITDTSDIPSLESSDLDELLDRGREVVDAASEVFDELERRYGGKRRKLYSSIPAGTVQGIAGDEQFPASAGLFQPFLGAPLDAETLSRLEDACQELAGREKLKSVTFDVRDSIIYLHAEPYPSKPGEISLGFHGKAGLYTVGDEVYVNYYPDVVADGYLSLTPKLDFSFGAKIDEGVQLYSGLDYAFIDPWSYYGYAELRYGELFWTSARGYEKYDFSNSFRARAMTGFSLSYGTLMRIDLLAGTDYTFVASDSSDGLGDLNDVYVYGGLGFTFDSYDEKDLSSTGFEGKLRLTVGGDFPDPQLSYELHLDFRAVGSPSEFFQFIVEGEASSLRRPTEYAAAWAVTKTGLLTPDYCYAMGGVLVPLPSSLYLIAGIYLEATASEAEDYYPDSFDWKLDMMVPFGELDSDGVSLGGKLAFGMQTAFGRIGTEIYLSDTARVSVLVGLE